MNGDLASLLMIFRDILPRCCSVYATAFLDYFLYLSISWGNICTNALSTDFPKLFFFEFFFPFAEWVGTLAIPRFTSPSLSITIRIVRGPYSYWLFRSRFHLFTLALIAVMELKHPFGLRASLWFHFFGVLPLTHFLGAFGFLLLSFLHCRYWSGISGHLVCVYFRSSSIGTLFCF